MAGGGLQGGDLGVASSHLALKLGLFGGGSGELALQLVRTRLSGGDLGGRLAFGGLHLELELLVQGFEVVKLLGVGGGGDSLHNNYYT